MHAPKRKEKHASIDRPAFIPFSGSSSTLRHLSPFHITLVFVLLSCLSNQPSTPPPSTFQTPNLKIHRPNPLPNPTPLAGPLALAVPGPNVRILLHHPLDPGPDPFSLILAERAPQHVIPELGDADEALADSAFSGQRGLCREAVKRRVDKGGDLSRGGAVAS